MNIAISIVAIVFIVFICPILIGYYWRNVFENSSPVFVYLAGFMTILAVFEIICVPLNLIRFPIRIEFPAMTVLLIAICAPSGYRLWKNKRVKESQSERKDSEKMTVPAVICLVTFLLLLAAQVFCTLRFDMGFWTSDDGAYVTYSEAAVHDGTMFQTNEVTGDYAGKIEYKRATTAIYNYFAYCRFTTGIPTAILEHTIYAVLLLLMAYGACLLLAETVFEKQEDRYIFLIVLSLCYLFGKFTHYSATFRLLGPIWQGKAILAVVVLPFILYYFPTFIREKVTVQRMLFVVVVSTASMSMTLGGAVTMALVPGLLALLCFLQKRRVSVILYYAAGMVIPAIVSGIYLIGR